MELDHAWLEWLYAGSHVNEVQRTIVGKALEGGAGSLNSRERMVLGEIRHSHPILNLEEEPKTVLAPMPLLR